MKKLIQRRWLRLKRMETGALLVEAFRFSLLIFAAWMLLQFAFWLVPAWMGWTDIDTKWDLWSIFEGASSAGAFALAFGAGLVALVELNENIESRNLSTYKDVFERMMSPDEVAARRFLFQEMPKEPQAQIDLIMASEEARENVRKVLYTLDYLGFLVTHDWVTHEAVIGWFSPIVMRAWHQVGAFVHYERERRKEPDYYIDAENLAIRCKQWRIDHGLPVEPYWVDDAV
ncbi:MAG: hypothetical protein Kow00124_07910 [Anaerolineae bacterium]